MPFIKNTSDNKCFDYFTVLKTYLLYFFKNAILVYIGEGWDFQFKELVLDFNTLNDLRREYIKEGPLRYEPAGTSKAAAALLV